MAESTNKTVEQTVPETVEPTVAETVEQAPAADAPDSDIEGLDPSIDDLAALLPTNIGPEKEDEDAPVTDETPAEDEPTDDTPAEGAAAADDDAGTPVDASPAPEAVAPKAEPQPDPTAEARQQRQARLVEINAAIKAIRAIKPEDRDPYEHGNKLLELVAEKDEIRDAEDQDRQAAVAKLEQTQAYEAVWTGPFAEKHPLIGAKDGRAMWERIDDQVSTDYPNASEDFRAGVLNDRFKQQIRVVEGQRRAAAAKNTPVRAATAKPPAKPAGTGRVMPSGIGTARPKSAPKTAEDEIDALLTKELSNFMPR